MTYHQFPVKKAARLTLAGLLLLLFAAGSVCLFIMIGKTFRESAESLSPEGCATSASAPAISAEMSDYTYNSDGCLSENASLASCGHSALSDMQSSLPAAEEPSDFQKVSGEYPVILSDGSDFPLILEPAETQETIEATAAFFLERVPALNKAISESGYYSCEKLLDPGTDTWVYMIARNDACASNMNGYFYYIFEKSASSRTLSPFVLNLAKLFNDENRESAVASGTFSDPGIRTALRLSLIAALGRYYKEEIYNFIISKYIQNFAARLSEDPLNPPVFSMESSGLEIVFHCSFLTYVEFYIDP